MTLTTARLRSDTQHLESAERILSVRRNRFTAAYTYADGRLLSSMVDGSFWSVGTGPLADTRSPGAPRC